MTFDCADPHAQAAFWAQVFGTAVEDRSALVDQLITDGRLAEDERVTIDGRSAFRDVAPCSDPAGIEPRFFFQRVREPKGAKNRVAGVPGEDHVTTAGPDPGRLVARGVAGSTSHAAGTAHRSRTAPPAPSPRAS